MILVLPMDLAHASPKPCDEGLSLKKTSSTSSLLARFKSHAVDKTLDVMASLKGLPRYLKRNEELKTSGGYLEYRNFGEMGLAEMGISVRFNRANLEALNTGKPLLIIANHHLGIADGLALQYLAGEYRPDTPSLLFLARWIEKLLPHAVFGDAHHWGTAIPVEINKPRQTDPLYELKMAEVKAFNSAWNRVSIKELRKGGALIIFPAGHVASINGEAGRYPDDVYDAPNSWQEGFLSVARMGKADIVFANVGSVNSEAFYRNRKRFGGGDKERVIWFFSEALTKKGQTIDIHFSKPMKIDEVYTTLSQTFGFPKETLVSEPALTAELMRQLTYKIPELVPQTLDATNSPKIDGPANASVRQ